MLVAKLGEEVTEYRESGNPAELADILEVIRALSAEVHGLTLSDIEQIRAEKEADRGGFKEGLILEKVKDNE
jgi:predicted house-cleaning noncanonical NTP pyrophosphatase (MazG superfamily)